MDTVNHIKLRVERTHVPAVLRALLTAIFFHRRLDNLDPETIDVLETHVASAGEGGSGEIARQVQGKIDEFSARFIDAGADSGEIAVVFLQRKNRKGWFAVTEALVPWEEHLVTVTFVKRATTSPLPGALLQLLTFCNEHKANVPPLVGTNDQNNLSHQILISPPPPDELFAPASPGSPPTGRRALSPPPRPATTGAVSGATEARTAMAGRSGMTGLARRQSTSTRSASPMTGAAIGYLEQAKDGLLGAKAGVVGWGGRAVGAAFGARGG